MYIAEKYREEDQFEHFPKRPAVYGIVINRRLVSIHQSNSLYLAAVSHWSKINSNINFEARNIILRKAYFKPELYSLGFVVFEYNDDEIMRKNLVKELIKEYEPILNKNKKEIPFTLEDVLAASPVLSSYLHTIDFIPSNIISKREETPLE